MPSQPILPMRNNTTLEHGPSIVPKQWAMVGRPPPPHHHHHHHHRVVHYIKISNTSCHNIIVTCATYHDSSVLLSYSMGTLIGVGGLICDVHLLYKNNTNMIAHAPILRTSKLCTLQKPYNLNKFM